MCAVAEMKFSNNGTDWTMPESAATSRQWTLSSDDGTKTVYVKFKDAAGNWSSAYNDTIMLDTAAPATTASPAGGAYNAAQSVTLSCSDGTGSGCATRKYCLGAGCTPSTVYTTAISISGSTDLRFYSIDNAGNSETIKTASYLIRHSVTGVSNGHGAISCSSPVNDGATANCAITPDTGYYLENLTDNSADVTSLVAGSSYPIVNVTADHTVTASFHAYSIKTKTGAADSYHSDLQAALNSAINGDVFGVQEGVISGNLILNVDAEIVLEGGYNGDFSARTGMTTISGSLTINLGTVVVDGIVIQ